MISEYLRDNLDGLECSLIVRVHCIADVAEFIVGYILIGRLRTTDSGVLEESCSAVVLHSERDSDDFVVPEVVEECVEEVADVL